MATAQPRRTGLWVIPRKVDSFLSAVRFELTVFALPFAYLGMIFAAEGLPTAGQFLWITVAMVGARTLAMSANRLIDRHLDARNPRTAGRELPQGRLKPRELVLVSVVSLGVFLLAAAMLNTLALVLAPLVALYVVLYPYTKRFTWTCHFILGGAQAMAPAGAWIGVRGSLSWEAVLLSFAVACWFAGFDILYQTQDAEWDRREKLHSVPQQWGIAASLRWSAALHLLTALALLGVGVWLVVGWPYYIGWTIAAVLLIYEHRIVSPQDLSRVNVAFFNVNGYISMTVLAFALLSLAV